jgi:S1-C subfamily serine protease
MATPPIAPKKRTLYDILGVPRDAGAIDIGLAYKARTASLQNSPGADPNEINLVHEAYHVLCLPHERAAYDAKLLAMAEREAARAAGVTDLVLEPDEAQPPAWKRKPVLAGAAIVVALLGWMVLRPSPRPAAPAPKIVAQRELAPPGEATRSGPATTATAATMLAAPAVEKSGEQLFAELARSTARITVHDVSGRAVGLGSGVVIGSGQVITNCHVATAGGTLSVKVGGEQFSASVEVADEEYDLCRLSVSGLAAPAVPIGSIDSLRTGQKVYAIGAPQGLDLTISDGIVSAFRDMPQGRIVQTTAPISPGSSGGPLFDAYGRLVGIMTFQHRSGQNLNFAVPADWIANIRSRAASNPLPEAMGRSLSLN